MFPSSPGRSRSGGSQECGSPPVQAATADNGKAMAVVDDRTQKPNPQGEEKNAAHNPIGLKAETEGEEASS